VYKAVLDRKILLWTDGPKTNWLKALNERAVLVDKLYEVSKLYALEA